MHTTTFTDLYVEIQQYYAGQMQRLDDGDLAAYAGTSTQDGVFQHTPDREPARTREGILAELLESNARASGRPVRKRHWFTQINVEPGDDGTITVTSYCLVGKIAKGADPVAAPSCVVRDVLVREEDGKLYNRSRVITYDQL